MMRWYLNDGGVFPLPVDSLSLGRCSLAISKHMKNIFSSCALTGERVVSVSGQIRFIQKNLAVSARIICVSANFALDKKKELMNNILC